MKNTFSNFHIPYTGKVIGTSLLGKIRKITSSNRMLSILNYSHKSYSSTCIFGVGI